MIGLQSSTSNAAARSSESRSEATLIQDAYIHECYIQRGYLISFRGTL